MNAMTPRATSFFSLTLATLSALTLTTASTAEAQTLRKPSGTGGLSSTAAETALQPAKAVDAQQSADFIVAIVNSEPITNQEVRRELQRVQQQAAQQNLSLPPVAELVQQVLERLITDKAQLQVARDTGINPDDSAVDQAEQSVAQQNQVNVATLRERVMKEGVSVSQFRSQLRDQLTLTRLRERDVEARVRVSDAEVEQYLREQQSSANLANQIINIAQILIAVPDDATPAQISALQAKAQAALLRAKSGEDFGSLARELSSAADKANDGQLGLRPVDRYPPLFVQATQSLQIGGLSGVFRSGAGFHVLKLIDRQIAGLPAMTVTQSRARHILLRTSAQLGEAALRDKLLAYKQRIESGQADFAAIARAYSEDGSAEQGGDLGWATPGQFVPEFEAVMNSLRPGQISEPMVSRYGVHLIQLTERRNVKLSDREQRESVRGLLREKKLDESYLSWAQEIRARAYVEMREPPR